MIAWLLVRLGQDPSYIIGGTANNLGGNNAHAGQGRPLSSKPMNMTACSWDSTRT